jgi:hypothetical protein
MTSWMWTEISQTREWVGEGHLSPSMKWAQRHPRPRVEVRTQRRTAGAVLGPVPGVEFWAL